MVAQESQRDEAWGNLSGVGDPEREAAMLTRYLELAGISQDERKGQLRGMANAEYALPDEKLRSMTVSRLRILLQMDAEQAKTVNGDYDAVMSEMPASVAMRRVGLVQTLVADFTAEEEERLREIMPTVFGGAPRRKTGLEVEPSMFAAPEKSKRAWWAFWQKA
jgi:hypothetical protein